MTVDLLFADQAVDQGEGVGGVGQNILRPLALYVDCPAGEALAEIDAAADCPAIAGAGAKAEFVRFEHDRIDAMFGQFQRGRQPGIAAADDRHPRLSRHLDKLVRDRPIGFPPIGFGREIPVQNVGVQHQPQPIISGLMQRAAVTIS